MCSGDEEGEGEGLWSGYKVPSLRSINSHCGGSL